MPQPDPWIAHPSIARIRTLAVALGKLNERVVYIGGAIAPILHVAPPFRAARRTKDVDALTATTSYSQHGDIQGRLRDLGFREDMNAAHTHRWIGPEGVLFDLVPAGQHLGASGQEWDDYAVAHPATADIDGIRIHHANGPTFLALKLAAFHDRGLRDPATSHDLEDIMALIASRPQIVEEVFAERADLVRYVRGEIAAIVSHPSFDDLLAGNVRNAFDPPDTMRIVQERIEALARPGLSGYD